MNSATFKPFQRVCDNTGAFSRCMLLLRTQGQNGLKNPQGSYVLHVETGIIHLLILVESDS